jgi:hypothetical protein
MDPISLVVGALAAGVSASLSDTAKALTSDLYGRVKVKLACRPAGMRALQEHNADPEVWGKLLAKELDAAGVVADAGLMELAERVMSLADPA